MAGYIVGRIQTEPKVQDLKTWYSMIRGKCLLFFKVGGQRSRSYFHIVGKRCRQITELTISFRIIQLRTIDLHDESCLRSEANAPDCIVA